LGDSAGDRLGAELGPLNWNAILLVKTLRHRIQRIPPAPRLILIALLLVAAVICLTDAIISIEVVGDWGAFAVGTVLFAILVAAGLTIIADWLGIDTDES
jgi:hypothetical protein